MKRHSFDPLSLVFGMLFAAIGALYLAGNVDVADLVARFWPAALVLLGLAMLFSTRRTEQVPAAPLPQAWTAPPPVAPVSPTPRPAPPVAATPKDPTVSPSEKPLEPRAESTIPEKSE
jgi:hypothetical protein